MELSHLDSRTDGKITTEASALVLNQYLVGVNDAVEKPSIPVQDAGASFVLESKGKWYHAGSHLTTAIVGPTILTLPYAFRGMGWVLGLFSLTLVTAVTFYAYLLLSKVLDHCERNGRRHIRFRELAADILGRTRKMSTAPSEVDDIVEEGEVESPIPENKDPFLDAGAAFVLESKGKWFHAGSHLTTAIVGPTILTLPYAFRGMGWELGLVSLTLVTAVTFYAYLLMSKVLDHRERNGRRHIRFRELAADILGSGWMYYFVIIIQTAINTGIAIGTILLSGECIKIVYLDLNPNGNMKLYQFIIIVTFVMIILSQIPSFHSLRHINLASLVLSIGYTFLVVGGCINAGHSNNPPIRDYSLNPSYSVRTFDIFTSVSILASVFGIGILPEIQATLAPPAVGKMLKGLLMCYIVIILNFYSASIAGYWAFGNQVSSNVFKSLAPDNGPALAPTWLLGLAVIFVLLQLFAIGQVYSQVAYEIMERKSADVNKGIYALRNVIPRLMLRATYMIFCGFMAAMLPFFGDINAVVGAVGFIPLDFVLPMLLYNLAVKPSRKSFIYFINVFIMVVFTCVGLLGSFSSIRKLVLDVDKFKLFSNNVID